MAALVLSLTPSLTARRSARASRRPSHLRDVITLPSPTSDEGGYPSLPGRDSDAPRPEQPAATSGSKLSTSTACTTLSHAATSERPFLCEHPGCGKTFKKRNKLNRHLLSHTDDRKHCCEHPGCGKKFLRAQHLAAHQQTHSGPSKHTSDASATDALQKSFTCTKLCNGSVCGKQFWTKQKLDRHVDSVHELPGPGVPFADIDGGASLDGDGEGEAAQNERPGKLYICDHAGCELVFRKRKHLRAHIWDAHSDAPHLSPHATSVGAEARSNSTPDEVRQRPFACSWPGCTLRFPSNSHRRVHEQRHEEKKAKTYTCALPHNNAPSEQRGERSSAATGILTFQTWSLLRAHMREAHPPRCTRPECIDPETKLGRTFKSADGLKAHMKRHEERDALMQAEAEAEEAALEQADAAADANELPSGASTAASAAPFYGEPEKTGYRFACTFAGSATASACSKRFKTTRALDVHTRVVHQGERRFQCSRGCGRRFGYKCTKDKHEALAKCSVPADGEEEEEDPEPKAIADEEEEGGGATDDGEMDDDDDDDDDYFREEGGAVPERDAERPAVRTRRSSVRIADAAGPSVLGLPSPETLQVAARQLKKEKTKGKQRQALTGRARGVDAYSAGTSSMSKAASGRSKEILYDLFTGASYGVVAPSPTSSASTSAKRARTADAEAEAHVGDLASPSKRRKTKGRIYACPWRRIVTLQRAAATSDDVAVSSDDDDEEEAEAEEGASGQEPDTGPLPDCSFRFSRMYDVRRHVLARHGVDLSTFDKDALDVIMGSV